MAVSAIVQPLRLSRVVSTGQVFCPVQRKDVDIDGCMSCEFLEQSSLTNEGDVSRITCAPPYRLLTGSRDTW